MGKMHIIIDFFLGRFHRLHFAEEGMETLKEGKQLAQSHTASILIEGAFKTTSVYRAQVPPMTRDCLPTLPTTSPSIELPFFAFAYSFPSEIHFLYHIVVIQLCPIL